MIRRKYFERLATISVNQVVLQIIIKLHFFGRQLPVIATAKPVTDTDIQYPCISAGNCSLIEVS